ncbi:MAG: WbqC family protein [Flavobacteriaceae bacterium]|jgi:hypothetical protein|nr:WbqC family protein [Flavobacteriaceae bacterium]
MTPVVCPAYLPNIIYCSWLLVQNKVFFGEDTHFQKQTFRNRTEICGPNGRLKLTIPIVHSKSEKHQKENEVLIANTTDWQKHHWKSICTAYRSSPFFEFYEADLAHFYEKKATHLMDFNLALIQKTMELIETPFSFEIVGWDEKKYQRMDFLINAKKMSNDKLGHYTQVFENKNGFLGNLSILDVLFNLGPETPSYLKKQAEILF